MSHGDCSCGHGSGDASEGDSLWGSIDLDHVSCLNASIAGAGKGVL